MRRWSVLLATVALLMGRAWAQQAVFGDWGVSSTKYGMFAVTQNDSGEAMGEFCYYKSGICEWLLGMHTGCKKGATGVVLANAEASASSLDMLCMGKLSGTALYEYRFNSWKALEAAFQDSARVGFAVPLASDRFSVVRFSLAGRTEAQKAMEASFNSKLKKVRAQGTKDQIL